jgi:hypothetical protein
MSLLTQCEVSIVGQVDSDFLRSLENLPQNGKPPQTLTHNTDIFNDNKTSEIPSADGEIVWKGKAAGQRGTSSYEDQTTLEVERQIASVPPSRPSKSTSDLKISLKSPSINRTEITSVSSSGTKSSGQSIKEINSLILYRQQSSLPKAKISSSRKLSSLSHVAKNVATVVAAPNSKLGSSSTANQTSEQIPGSEPVEQVSEFDNTAPALLDLGTCEVMEALDRELETNLSSVPEEQPATRSIMESFNNEGRQGRQLELEILNVICSDAWERKLNKSYTLPFVLTHMLFPILQKHLFPKHPLSKFNQDQGFIYIFKSPLYPGYVKIGKTKQTPEKRITQWRGQCEFTCIHIKDENEKGSSIMELWRSWYKLSYGTRDESSNAPDVEESITTALNNWENPPKRRSTENGTR